MRVVLALSKPGRHNNVHVLGAGVNCPLPLSSSTPYPPPAPSSPSGWPTAGLCSQNTSWLENEACDLKPFYISELNADIITTLSSPTICPHSHCVCVVYLLKSFKMFAMILALHFQLWILLIFFFFFTKQWKELLDVERKILEKLA